MTTLTALKATVADDLARSDLTTQIAAEITNAINHYKARRFYFNETRAATFATVAAQSAYATADDADIPLFLKIDDMQLEDGSTTVSLNRYDPAEIEQLIYEGSSGRPYAYAYINRTFKLYPIPDDTYTVRPIGHIEVAAPASDGEASNVWMTEAYELLRCRAKAYLYLHVIQSPDKAKLMFEAEQDALDKLTGATTDRVAIRAIEKTQW